MTSARSLVIASRESKLAMVQSEMIRDRLMGLHPGLTVSILGMTTQGDQILDRPLAQIGGKGLFIKELEVALQDGRADLAVHSMKDMPAVLPPGFELVVVGDREAPQDAFVSNKFNTLAELPKGARVGTSSLRRECQLRLKYPHLTIHSLRGNVGTRLSKLDADQYDAIILAAAGLRRLGLGDRIRSVLTLEESLPAIGQGALAIEYRSGREDVAAVLAPLTAADTTAIVTAERALGAELLGSCDVPLAGHARILGEGGQRQLVLEGFIGLPDGSTHLRDQVKGDPAEARALGKALGQKLLANGAQAILDQLAHHKK